MTTTVDMVVEFATVVPGFPEARTWTMTPWGDDESSPFKMLSSDEVEGLAFVIVPPFYFFPEYAPDLDDATVDALKIEKAEDVLVYVVLTVGESIEDTTANLLGPIVINSTNNLACQAVLHGPGLSTKTPLVPT